MVQIAWSAPPTLTDGQVLTGAHTQIWRDDLLETAPGKATAAGQIWVSTAANAGAMRTPFYGHITGACTATTITTYGDPATGAVGPAVTVTSGISAIFALGAVMTNGTGGGGANMSVAISGATTVAADDSCSLQLRTSTAGWNSRMSSVHFRPSLNAGSNVFTAKYTTPTGGTATYSERHVLVLPL